MTPADRRRIRAAAVAANDADHAAGLLPSRYVTDEATLARLARLLLPTVRRSGRPNTNRSGGTDAA